MGLFTPPMVEAYATGLPLGLIAKTAVQAQNDHRTSGHTSSRVKRLYGPLRASRIEDSKRPGNYSRASTG
jgi:hypothetical protein